MAIISCLETALCGNGYSTFFASTYCAIALIGMGTFFSGFIAKLVDQTKEFEKCGKLLLFITVVIYFLLIFVMFEPERHVAIIILMMLLGMTSLSVFPIAQELVVETTYPVGSGTSCGCVWLCSQISNSLFIFILLYVNTEIDLTIQQTKYANISTCGNTNSFYTFVQNETNLQPLFNLEGSGIYHEHECIK